jgi:hypothetical protein
MDRSADGRWPAMLSGRIAVAMSMRQRPPPGQGMGGRCRAAHRWRWSSSELQLNRCAGRGARPLGSPRGLAGRAPGLEATRGIALVVDSNSERAVPLRFDTEGGTSDALLPLPDPRARHRSDLPVPRPPRACPMRSSSLRTASPSNGCCRHDAAPRLVREFAVAPDARHCRSDDGRDRLFVSEPGGLWMHRAEPEADDTREVVALRRPHGPLQTRRRCTHRAGATRFRCTTMASGCAVSRSPSPARAALPIVTARVQTVASGAGRRRGRRPGHLGAPHRPVGFTGAGHRQEAWSGGLRSAGARSCSSCRSVASTTSTLRQAVRLGERAPGHGGRHPT